jgi:hypothetical protein
VTSIARHGLLHVEGRKRTGSTNVPSGYLLHQYSLFFHPLVTSLGLEHILHEVDRVSRKTSPFEPSLDRTCFTGLN